MLFRFCLILTFFLFCFTIFLVFQKEGDKVVCQTCPHPNALLFNILNLNSRSITFITNQLNSQHTNLYHMREKAR